MTSVLWIVLALIAVVAAWVWATYNGLIRSRNATQESWKNIDVQLKRRYDLIPNLIKTVKGYAAHEKSVLENVTKARAGAVAAGAKGPGERAKSEGMLTDALRSLFAVAENYPDLKANQNFAKLQDELSNTENMIAGQRGEYNANVRDFNTKMEVFPTNMIASSLGFTKFEFFGLEEGEKEAASKAPKVEF